MLNVGTPELLVIIVVGLLVLGPKRLPEVARQAGRAMAQVRRMTDDFQAQVERATRGEPEDDAAPARPVRTRPLVAATVDD